MRITKSRVENLAAPEQGTALFWDDDLPGFGVRITAAGAKAFIAQGRAQGKSRRVTLGKTGLLTAEQARKKAKAALGAMAEGKDPVATRKRQAAVSVTLRAVVEDYIENKRRRDGKPLADRTKQDIEKHLRVSFGAWADKPIAAITRDAVSRRYKAMADRSVAQGNQAMRVLSALINFARGRHRGPNGEHIIADNPVAVIHESGLYRGDVAPRKTRVPAGLVGQFYSLLEATRTSGSPTVRTKATLAVVLLLTGLRKADVIGRQWQDVSLDDATLYVPDTKHRSPRLFPLAEQAVDALRDLRELSGEKLHVFAGEGTKRLHIYDAREGLDPACAAIGQHIALHDLRRTWTDACGALRIDPLAVELLANRKGAAYQALAVRLEHYDESTDLTRYAEEAQRIADYFDQQRQIAEADNVVHLAGARA